MKLRTRLPRASTNACVAASAPPEQLQLNDAPQNEPAISLQQCAQILHQLDSFDTEAVFTGALTPDGRLTADGPQVTGNLRYRDMSCASFLRQQKITSQCAAYLV